MSTKTVFLQLNMTHEYIFKQRITITIFCYKYFDLANVTK